MAQRRELHDKYFKLAKEEGYLARSAYKLKQIQEKRRIIRAGDRVLDLGCAPGSWLQVASELTGGKEGGRGVVLGLDLQEVTERLAPNVRAVQGDAFKTPADELMLLANREADGVPRPFDALLSDMAPSTSGGGGGSGDHFKSVELCRRVLDLAAALLKPGGNLVMKVFEGESYPDLLRDTSRRFDDTKGYKPDATRGVSKEMYIVAKGFKGGTGLQTGASAGGTGVPPVRPDSPSERPRA
ncbi:MAG: RlmE family RNA methyltransferase [Phycisphaerales bacterium]|nr:RlmE family RNA methyltransferase [Phycisphaerales bacterium]